MAPILTQFLSLLATHGINAIGTYTGMDLDDPMEEGPFHILLYYNNTVDYDNKIEELTGEVPVVSYTIEYSGQYKHYLDEGIHGPLSVPSGFFTGLEGSEDHPEPHQYQVYPDPDAPVQAKSSVEIEEEEIEAKQEQWIEDMKHLKERILTPFREHGFNAIAGFDKNYRNDTLIVFFNHTSQAEAAHITRTYMNSSISEEFPYTEVLSFARYNFIVREGYHDPIDDIPDGFFSGQEEALKYYTENPYSDYYSEDSEDSEVEEDSEDSDDADDSEVEEEHAKKWGDPAEYAEDEDGFVVLPMILDSSRFLIEPSRLSSMNFWKMW